MMKYGITQNTAIMTAASVGQKIIAFVYFTVIARQIGVEGTGKYFFALSFTTLFVVLIDLGFTTVLIREAARIRERLDDFLSSVLAVKLLLGTATYGIMALTIGLLDHDTETRHMVYLSGLTMLFDSLHLTFYGVLRALGDLRYESISMIGSQLLTMILGSLFLLFDLPLLFLILAFTIPSFLNALFAGTLLKKKIRSSPLPASQYSSDHLSWRHGSALCCERYSCTAVFICRYHDSLSPPWYRGRWLVQYSL